MKTSKYYLLFPIMIVLAVPVQATIHRVNPDPLAGPDYTTLQEAHDGATAGDTLNIEPGTYGDLTVTKRLVIMGPGYFLGQNPEVQASYSLAGIQSITFNSGSENSLMTGIVIQSRVAVNTSNITIKRNLFQSTYPGDIVDINGGTVNTIFAQNYLSKEDGWAKGINIAGDAQATISNNFIWMLHYAIQTTSSATVTVENNILRGPLTLYDSVIRNNIVIEGSVSGTASLWSNNIANADQFGSANNNQANVDMTTVFEYAGSTDGQWQLKAGSPALGAGGSGVDCGMFGGGDPYVLSGIGGSMPRIYFLETSGEGTQSGGLQVHLKAKTGE